MTDTEYLTPAEVASILRVHQNTVRQMLRTGAIPAIKLPGAGRNTGWRIRRSDIDKITARPPGRPRKEE